MLVSRSRTVHIPSNLQGGQADLKPIQSDVDQQGKPVLRLEHDRNMEKQRGKLENEGQT